MCGRLAQHFAELMFIVVIYVVAFSIKMPCLKYYTHGGSFKIQKRLFRVDIHNKDQSTLFKKRTSRTQKRKCLNFPTGQTILNKLNVCHQALTL